MRSSRILGIFVCVFLLHVAVATSGSSKNSTEEAVATEVVEAEKVLESVEKELTKPKGKNDDKAVDAAEGSSKKSIALSYIRKCLQYVNKVNRYASYYTRYLSKKLIGDKLLTKFPTCNHPEKFILTALYDQVLMCGGQYYLDDPDTVRRMAEQLRDVVKYLRTIPDRINACKNQMTYIEGKALGKDDETAQKSKKPTVLCYIEYAFRITAKLVYFSLKIALGSASLTKSATLASVQMLKNVYGGSSFKKALRSCLKKDAPVIEAKCKKELEDKAKKLKAPMASFDYTDDDYEDDITEDDLKKIGLKKEEVEKIGEEKDEFEVAEDEKEPVAESAEAKPKRTLSSALFG